MGGLRLAGVNMGVRSRDFWVSGVGLEGFGRDYRRDLAILVNLLVKSACRRIIG
jgi:hypothetical protein